VSAELRAGAPLPWGLLAAARRDRMRAIRELVPSAAAAYALRRALFTDPHAEVRAAAARRLGDLGELRGLGAVAIEPSRSGGAAAEDRARLTIEPWLLDALGDASPLVRDAILRALVRAGTTASVPALRELAERDGMWWVRRGAVYALAAIAGAAEVPALTRALADPFWRVRHAAVKVLAVLGARDPDVRDEVMAAGASAFASRGSEATPAITFLRGTWGPVAIEAPARAASASRLPPALLDPDPAVVAARLEQAGGELDPVALVELLCDPHVPLRALAARRVAAGGRAALAAALDWLEEPRIPHVADTVYELLDGLGDPAAELAAFALARPGRPGAARWAIGWVAATRFEALADAAVAAARAGDASLRRAALRLASDAELRAWAEPGLVDAIAVELHERRTPSAHDALLALDGAAAPRTRALQVDVRARRGDWAGVRAALADPHHGPRAIAARWWVRRDPAAAPALASDPDPAVREAALTPETAAAALGEVDPWVRRAAIRMLAAAWADHPGLPAGVVAAARAALADADPQLRAHACRLAGATGDRAVLALLLERLADRAASVRAAAHDALERLPGADAALRALLDEGGLSPVARATAHGWLLRALDEDAAGRARAALEREADPRIRAVLGAVAGDAAAAPLLRIEPGAHRADAAGAPAGPPSAAAPVRERRPFGRAGFDVAPLAISGAYDLAPRALRAAEAAGVDLYFWEPGYDALGRFLGARGRRDRTRVITGSYHADARSIRLDVHRALRALRRDALDVFLLFWTRSPARVDAQAFELLDDLRRTGLVRAIGFSTHHRDLARDAIRARPWDVVMIRHSAAHPGIEGELLPTARELGTAVVTFSALTYGRMISGPGAPSPADCYRYSLAQPGVTACISAPRRPDELLENLAALAQPRLDPAELAALRAHGARVHAESQRFNTLLRQPTRDAAAAARELLAAELPPADAGTGDAAGYAATAPKLPIAGGARRSRARLGSSRRSR
jgi:diketogulonate reductase-like aldo/keto reductase